MSEDQSAKNLVRLSVAQAASDFDPLSPSNFEHSQRVAKMFASSELVPPHLRGKLADCLIAYAIAKRTREEPLVVLQNIYFVSGRAGWSAQYMIAKANRSGVFSRRINWRVEGAGENLRVTAFATLADSGEVVEATASMAMAKAEGWTRNTKYQTMPDQMLRYRSAAMLIRLFCPEVMMGLPMVDEVEDISAARGPSTAIDITPGSAAASIDALLSQQDADNIAPAVSDSPDHPSPAEPTQAASPSVGTTGASAEPISPLTWLDGVRSELAKVETVADLAMLDAAYVVHAAELGATTLRNYKTAVLQARTRIGGA